MINSADFFEFVALSDIWMVDGSADFVFRLHLLEDSGILGLLVDYAFECDLVFFMVIGGKINRTSGTGSDSLYYCKAANV